VLTRTVSQSYISEFESNRNVEVSRCQRTRLSIQHLLRPHKFVSTTKHFQQDNITMTPSNKNINNSTSPSPSISISDSNNNAEADLRMTMRRDFNGQKTVNLAQSLRRMKRRLLLEFVEQDMTTVRQSNSFNSDSQSCHSSCSSLSCSVESED
jgi:hypothetical protein